MPRVKTGVVRRKRHKKVLKAARGFYSGRRKHFRKAKEQEFQDMENALQRYLAGAQDEFTKWQRSAEYELIMKINKIIETMAINEGYDLILEGSGGVKYTKGAYDLTDDVLFKLNKTPPPSDSTPE